MMNEPQWITVKEYADLYRVHVQTVYSALKAGRINHPVQRIGGRGRGAIRIDVSRETIPERKAS